MSLLFISITSILGIWFGKIIFHKWINHLTIYCFVWGISIFLYELKFLPYPDLTQLAWFFIIASFLSFLFGILTIVNARSLIPHNSVHNSKPLPILIDKGKTLKYTLFFFSAISLIAAIQHWIVLINMFGSIPSVLINANVIYRLNVNREIKEFIPYLPATGYIAIFFSGIYTAYKGKFSLLTFLPFLGIILKELATVGRAGMLLALFEFIFSFILFRNLLKNISNTKFRLSKYNAVMASVLLVLFFIVSASLVKMSRINNEDYSGSSRELRQLKNNIILSPSIYLYLSSNVGVLSKYLESGGENAIFGQNSLLPVYGILARLGITNRPEEVPRGYYIPLWTNSASYIRELHADFGIMGVFLIPFLLGAFITWLWFRFYEQKSMILFAFLVYFNLIIVFSVFGMITRSGYWFISLFIIIVILPFLEKIAWLMENKSTSHYIFK